MLQLNLPELPDRRIAARVTPDALRQIRGGHPWVYAESIIDVSDSQAPAGTLAVVFDNKRRFAAIGLWDPNSPIRLRILHVGSPQPIDADFWYETLRRAIDRRRTIDTSMTTGMRVLHGENDGVGGLVVDRFDTTAVMKVYTPAWLPHLSDVVAALRQSARPDRVVLRLGRTMAASAESRRAGLVDGMTIVGLAPTEPIRFLENGLTFAADVELGQKTGHFLDQRDNRARVKALAHGHSVLDVFSNSGGFSVHAAAGGASHVHTVDVASDAIESALVNMALNGAVTASSHHRTTTGDAFEVMVSLDRDSERYDIVVIDPPAFAGSAADRGRALRAYRKLAHLGLRLTKPGGWLVQSSCSSRITEAELVGVIEDAARSSRRDLFELTITGQGVDHPVTFPQGRYLKAVFTRAG